MTCSLIITTYNWEEALELVLMSILEQKELPDEVIIADDGSRNDTKELIEKFQDLFPIPLVHSWQEDQGFRAAESRNRAVNKASSEYIIFIDGDMLLHESFVKEHKKFAKKNFFIQGSRVLLSEKLSNEILVKKSIKISFLTNGIKNRLNAIHSYILALLFKNISQSHKGIKTCNFSLYKEELYSVNGFNNDFIGWGREDSEFVERLYNKGISRLNVKHNLIAYHLWHLENDRKSLERNDEILENTFKYRLEYCENGINNL